MIHSKFICACFCFGNRSCFIFSLNDFAAKCNKLRNSDLAEIFTRDVTYCACAYRVIFVERSEIIICSVNCKCENFCFCIPLPRTGCGIYQYRTNLAVCVLVDFNELFADFNGIATVDSSNRYIGRFCRFVGCDKIFGRIDFACEVKHLAEFCLHHSKFVCACFCFGNGFNQILLLACSIDSDCKFFRLCEFCVTFTNRECCNERYGFFIFTECYDKFAVFNLCILRGRAFFECPSNCDIIVNLRFVCKSNFNVRLNRRRNFSCFDCSVNLFLVCIGLHKLICEDGCGCGSQIECAAEHTNNTGHICGISAMFGKECLERFLFRCCERARGRGNTDVCLLFAKSKVIVRTVTTAVFRYFDAFDCDKHCLFANQLGCFQIFCILECFGEIDRFDSFDCAVKHFNLLATYDFVCAAVILFRTCNSDGHTDFDVIGGCFGVVNVNAAVGFAVIVNGVHIKTAVACAVVFGKDCGDNTVNIDLNAVFCRCITCIIIKFEFRNSVLELDFCLCAIVCGNRCCERVFNFNR